MTYAGVMLLSRWLSGRQPLQEIAERHTDYTCDSRLYAIREDFFFGQLSQVDAQPE